MAKERKQLNQDQYWASLEDDTELLNHLDEKLRNYYDDIRDTGLVNVWERNYRLYYGGEGTSQVSLGAPLFSGSQLRRGGKQGQKTMIKINHHRNILSHILQITTNQKPAVQARALNTDHDSQSQTILANGLEDFYWKEKGVDSVIKDAVEVQNLFAESFVLADWDAQAGETFTMGEGKDGAQPIIEGEQNYSVYGPIDVARDPNIKNYGDVKWHIIRRQVNRWDLISKTPEYEEEIMDAPVFSYDDEEPTFSIRYNASITTNDDLVYEYVMYHDKTPALPNGRYVRFVRNQILEKGALAYRKVPVFRLCGSPLHGSIYGYTIGYDTAGIQKAYDELMSIAVTNNKTLGTTNVWTQTGDNLSTKQLSVGLTHLQSAVKPEGISLSNTPPELYQLVQMLEHAMETIGGVSSTVRGNPEANLKSGTALALVVSQSIQFVNSLESAIQELIGGLATILIHNLIDFADTPRTAQITGKTQKSAATSFEAKKDLNQIARFVVEPVNPLSKTVAGRAEIANNLLQQGLLRDPKDYIMVLTTGNLDPAIEATQSEKLRITAENEELRAGRPVQALLTDNHVLDIREHATVLDSPAARLNPSVVQAVLNHIQEHMELALQMPPALAAIMGQPPLPMPQPQTGSQPMNPQDPVQAQGEAAPAKLPNPPKGTPPESQEAYDQNMNTKGEV